MLSGTEQQRAEGRKEAFLAWLKDFGDRNPAVHNYMRKIRIERGGESLSTLVKSWNEVLLPFDVELLHAVTAGIEAGRFEPVPNEQLGAFAHEIRTRARVLRDEQRRERERTERVTEVRVAAEVLQQPSTAYALRCANATRDLLGARYQEPWRSGPVRLQPFEDPVDAAIYMATEHTDADERACLACFEKWGLTWPQIKEHADTCRDRPMFLSVKE